MEGKVQYTIDNEKVELDKGEIMYIPRSAVRSGENYQCTLHQKYTILFIDHEKEIGIPFLDKRQFFKIKPRNFQYFKQRAEYLYRDLKGNNKYNLYICLGILQEIIGMLAREKEETETSPMKLKYAQTIQEYIIHHYRSPIEIDSLAKLIQKSPNYTISIFKEVTGQTPIQYLHQLRILEASNLLLNSNMAISSISEYLGYYDTSYFCRVFKRLMSLSPQEYQKTIKTADSANSRGAAHLSED